MGVALGAFGVVPWLLFGVGWMRAWPGVFHALTMTEGFLVAVAAGFLGTMLPRRTRSAPMSWLELSIITLALAAVPSALIAGSIVGAQAAYLVALVTLIQFAARRFRSRPMPSFIFLPMGLLAGVSGALLLMMQSPWALAAGRSLVEEGLLDGLVLALAPMLMSLIAHDRPPGDRGPRWPWLFGVVLFAGSFVVQHALNERAGLFLRGLTVLALLVGAGAWQLPSVPGLHRRLFLLALWLVPLGPLAAAARPALRIPLLHFTFIGGLSLLIFAVSTHVSFLHTGRERLARRQPWPVALVGALTVAAMLARVTAERFSQHYFEALSTAALLWLSGAATWLLFVVPMLRERAQSLRPR
jgi:uncharacterized protein involved in response to NO